MRKTTLLWLILALFCGTGIFHTSQRVHDEREKIAALDEQIGKEQESLRVLNAEWSYLNQPARLEKLSTAYLHLAPLKGSQFVKVEDVALRGAVVADATPPATSAPVVKIKPPAQTHHPRLVRGPKSASARLVDSQVIGGSKPNTPHNFADLMKNLHAGVE